MHNRLAFSSRLLRPFSSVISNVPNPLPATFLRGGTSKGIFLNRSHLPIDQAQWGHIFLGIMGSPDPEHGRQLNGMGGGISSLSKVCVVGQPSEEQRANGIDVEYTFCQIGIRDSSVDYSGNCGNLSSMIGVFAIDEGIFSAVGDNRSIGTVRSFNTNTSKRIDTTFPISSRENGAVPLLELPQTSIAGVPGKASQITLDFVSPSGARTGKLLPSGNPVDNVEVGAKKVRASLVDATNPTVFITSDELRAALDITPNSEIDYENVSTLETLELIRQQGARLMGLDPSVQAQPKIAILDHPSHCDAIDVVVRALSMGVLHKAVPMTVGLCLGVSCAIEDTLAWEIIQRSRTSSRSDSKLVKLKHPSGIVEVGSEFSDDGTVSSAKVVRTGRRLMKGSVWW